jgi:hypothetical protein
VLSAGAYVAALGIAMLPVLLHHNLHAFWKDTIRYQANRVTPFSVWGLWGGLSLEQHLLEGAAVAMAIALAFWPRRRGPVEVAALGGAIVLALQIVANYWLYSYVVWFTPLVLVGLFGSFTRAQLEPGAASELPEPAPALTGSRQPASALST